MSLIFKLPENNGGYCNQLWHLVGYYLLAKDKKLTFILDDSVWIWKNKNGWNDYFNSLAIKKKCKVIQKPIEYDTYERKKLNKFTLSEYREAFKHIMVLNDSLQKQLYDIMNKFNLKPNEFDAIMIRRGSKLFQESNYISTDKYLNKLVEKNTKIIFLQTDDYNCYEELKNIIKNRKLNIQVYTICPEYKRGGQTGYSRELKYIKDNINKSRNIPYIKNFVKNKKSEQEYTPEEMKTHMEEMIVGLEICLFSRYLSTDLQSNITRMLYTRHNNPNNVLTANKTLLPSFNRIVGNPSGYFRYL